MSERTEEFDVLEEEEEILKKEAQRKSNNDYMRVYSRVRNKERRWLIAHAVVLARELIDSGKLDELSSVSRQFVEEVYDRWPRKYPPLLMKIFDGDVRVGRYVTARDCIEKAYRGRVDMANAVKRWRKNNGIVIDFELDPEGTPLDARYIIRELPIDTTGWISITASDLGEKPSKKKK